MAAHFPPFSHSRYVITDPIGRGATGRVYRVRDRLTGEDVALKRVEVMRSHGSGSYRSGLSPKSSQSAPQSTALSLESSRLLLVHEFRTLATLRHPNIVSVLDYGVDDAGVPFITMNLLSAAQSLLAAGQDLPLPGKILLLSQILHALTYLHRRRVLHRDLKPSNLLVLSAAREAEPQVKLVDFGLALSESAGDLTSGLAGTPGYIAPEVLAGESPSAVSDLYSFGVVAAELLCGQHPFSAEGASWASAPELRPLADADPLRILLTQLLRPSPSDRIQSAALILAMLAKATAQPLRIETEATRDCVLNSAPMIGRTRELGWLEEALSRACQGRGECLLISGESGVGKSRLIEELRCRALISGVQVLRGQARAEGAALHLWREPLRGLCLQVPPDDRTASMLLGVLPELEQLLGRSIQTAPMLDAEGTPRRLSDAAAALLARSELPLLLLLEDLHWADTGSVDVLRSLFPRLGTCKVLVVATYRAEYQAKLGSELPNMMRLALPRLTPRDQAELAQSIVGAVGSSLPMQALLDHEAAGNPLFIVEVLRELVARAGSFDSLRPEALPQRVHAGGVLAAIRARLRRIPFERRQLLLLCAVAGRVLDDRILSAVDSRQTAAQFAEFLAACADLSVLEVSEGRWRFAHDILREELLAELHAAELKSLHCVVATALQTAYPQSAEHAASVALHLESAGDPDAAIDFHGIAAEHALHCGAAENGLHHANQMITLGASRALRALPAIRAHRLRAQALLASGNYYDCTQAIKDGERVIEAARPALAASAQKDPATTTIGQLVAKEAVLLVRLAETFIWIGEPREFRARLRSAVLHQRLLREPRIPGLICYGIAYVLAVRGRTWLAAQIVALGGQLHRLRGFQTGPIEGARMRAHVKMLAGNWDTCVQSTDSLLALAQQRSAATLRMHALLMKSNALMARGSTAAGLQTLDDLVREAKTSRHLTLELLAYAAKARALIRCGDWATAEQLLRHLFAQPASKHVVHLWMVLWCLIARVTAELGNHEEALHAARSAIAASQKIEGLGYLTIDAPDHLSLAMVLIDRQRMGADELPRILLKQGIAATAYTRRLPVARPAWLLAQVEHSMLIGDLQNAEKTARLVVDMAVQLTMPYEEARARQRLGEMTDRLPSSERSAHSHAATALYTRIKAFQPGPIRQNCVKSVSYEPRYGG